MTPHAESPAPELFADLPQFPPALPDDELRLLAILPEWPTTMELRSTEEAPAKRLKARGLVKTTWEKADPVAIRPTGFAGRLPEAGMRAA